MQVVSSPRLLPSVKRGYPERFVCLTEEPTEVLYALGEQTRIVGISGFNVRRLGALVGAATRAEQYALELEQHVASIRQRATQYSRRPRVYFEEWDEPMISGNRWVSELIGIAGGQDVFPERAICGLAKDRILADPGEVIRRAPDIILGSWCGKRFRPERVNARPGWPHISAVRIGEIHEIKGP
jgi:iron complex transport system substrate-binding protein